MDDLTFLLLAITTGAGAGTLIWYITKDWEDDFPEFLMRCIMVVFGAVGIGFLWFIFLPLMLLVGAIYLIWLYRTRHDR